LGHAVHLSTFPAPFSFRPIVVFSKCQLLGYFFRLWLMTFPLASSSVFQLNTNGPFAVAGTRRGMYNHAPEEDHLPNDF
jgi:hypothetical protein